MPDIRSPHLNDLLDDVSEADRAEQTTAAYPDDPTSEDPEPIDPRWDADPADIVEQSRTVPVDEDYIEEPDEY